MKKRIIAVVMMLVMVIACPFAVQSASAATDYDYLLEVENDQLSNSTATHSFTSSKAQNAYLYLFVKNQVDMGVKLTNTTETQSVSNVVYASDWEIMSDGWGSYVYTLSLKAASYELELQCLDTTQYEVYVMVPKQIMTISSSTATITAGQKKTLKVTDAPGTVKWKSSKTSVATVSSKGVVKAKKAGKATITATSGDQKVSCKVTVKKNVYTSTKLTLNNCSSYQASAHVHKAYYKGGKIVCNLNIVNPTIQKITKLKTLTITIKTSGGSTIAKQTFKNVKGSSLGSYSKKTKTLTISKSKVKKKSADLRNAVVYITGGYEYHY